jgi:hypothetical protein
MSVRIHHPAPQKVLDRGYTMSHDWRLTGALTLIALGFFGGCGGDVTAREGPVSVSFPGEPARTTSAIETPLGEIVARTLAWPDSTGRAQDGVRLELTVSDSPFGEATDDDAFRERVLDGARDGVLASTSGQLLSEGPMVVDGITGRRLEIAVDRGTVTLTALLFLAERSMVQVLAFAHAGEAPAARAGEYCQSFRFVPLRQEEDP